MKYFIALLFVAASFMPFAVHADMMPVGNHQVNNYIIVDNASAYPNYNLYITFAGTAGKESISEAPTRVPEGNYINDNTYTNGIIAVHKSNQSRIVYSADVQANCGAGCFSTDANSALIVTSTLVLQYADFLPDENSIVKKTQTIHIDSISDTAMAVRVVNTVTENKNGDKTITPEVAIENKSIVSVTQISSSILVGLLVVCIGIAGIFFAKKTWKK